MSVTALQVDVAENISCRLHEAIYHMHSAVEMLEGTDNDTCSDLASALNELIFSAESEKENCDDVLEEADRQEMEEMNREYERSVI